MPTLGEIKSLLSRHVGANNTANDRINLVRARLFPKLNFKDSKEQVILDVGADADGNSIVSLGRGQTAILAGAYRSPNVLCTGSPLGVRNSWSEFSKNGLGYGGLTDDFTEVPGHFCVTTEWTDPMYIRLKFEVSESSGTIYLMGTLANEPVWALNGLTWEKREAIAISGTTTVTSTKLFDAQSFKAKKPATNGRVTVFTVDSDGVETQVAVWEAADTLPRFKRYKIPTCEDVSAIEATTASTPSQYYTKAELDALFADSGTITVSTTGTTDLDYAAYFLRTVKIVAAAGSGAYTHSFTLDTSKPKAGAIFTVRLEVAASANPTLRFYSESTGGTLLLTVLGDTDNITYQTLRFEFDAADWHLLA